MDINVNDDYRFLPYVLEEKMKQFANICVAVDVYELIHILNVFNDYNKNKIFTCMCDFCYKNRNKIQHIFADNKCRYDDLKFMFKPEIFIFFYALDNCMFSITDNEFDIFDNDQIELIKTLWVNI